MAKKKKSGAAAKSGFAAISPEKYIRTKARTLPLGKCWINPDWKEEGLAVITISRLRPSGNAVLGVYLVDTFCMGVKDTFFRHNVPAGDMDETIAMIYHYDDPVEITYNEAHNLIYGAIEFAEEAGLQPVPEFKLTEYILQEDTDDIPIIEYEYGRDGIHYLICGPSGKEKKLIPELRRRLGGNFDFAYAMDDNDADADDWDLDEYDQYDEHYSYQYPEYPATPQVKHSFIAEELMKPEHWSNLPQEVADRIFALPPDEAAADLAAIILYEIGRTYASINDGTFPDDDRDGALLHAVNLLSFIDSRRALPALLEITRMNDAFLDFQLGDIGAEHLPQAIWRAAGGNLKPLEDFLTEEGLNTWMRLKVVEALTITANQDAAMLPPVLEAYRRLLTSMTSRMVNDGVEFDPTFAGCVIGELVEMDCTPLLPEIEAIFDTHMVDTGVTGDLAEVKRIITKKEFYESHPLFTYQEMCHRILPE